MVNIREWSRFGKISSAFWSTRSSLTTITYYFYCVNTSYPMDNCLNGRRDWSRQTSEKDVLYIIPTRPARRVHSPGGASYFLFLSRHCDAIAFFSFGVWRVKTCFHDKRIFCSTPNTSILFQLLRSSTVLSTTMSSPGQAMAGFDSHSKCARCRDEGVGDDLASSRKIVMSEGCQKLHELA